MAVFTGLRNGVLTLDSAGTQDTVINFNTNGTKRFVDGVDISDSNNFKIAAGCLPCPAADFNRGQVYTLYMRDHFVKCVDLTPIFCL